MSENMKLRCAVCGAQTKPLYHVDGPTISGIAYDRICREIGDLRYCPKCGTVKVVER